MEAYVREPYLHIFFRPYDQKRLSCAFVVLREETRRNRAIFAETIFGVNPNVFFAWREFAPTKKIELEGKPVTREWAAKLASKQYFLVGCLTLHSLSHLHKLFNFFL